MRASLHKVADSCFYIMSHERVISFEDADQQMLGGFAEQGFDGSVLLHHGLMVGIGNPQEATTCDAGQIVAGSFLGKESLRYS